MDGALVTSLQKQMKEKGSSSLHGHDYISPMSFHLSFYGSLSKVISAHLLSKKISVESKDSALFLYCFTNFKISSYLYTRK